MTGTSVKDPLAESYITVVHRLLDELTKGIEQTARIAELEAEIARRDAYQDVVTSLVNEAFAAEALDVEADAFDLPAFPAPFPNRFPILDEWSDVPNGVTYQGVDEDGLTFRNYGGTRWTINPDGKPSHESDTSEEDMSELAPFVEVV